MEHQPVASARLEEGFNFARMVQEALDAHTQYDSIMEPIAKVVQSMRKDRLPLNPAAVGYIFFAAKREGSEQAAEIALGIFSSLTPALRSKQVVAHSFS